MDKLFDVENKRVVITGGAGVLCGALAKYLAAQGAKVCIADYDELRANELANEIKANGGFALPIRMNVLDKDLGSKRLRLCTENFWVGSTCAD